MLFQPEFGLTKVDDRMMKKIKFNEINKDDPDFQFSFKFVQNFDEIGRENLYKSLRSYAFTITMTLN